MVTHGQEMARVDLPLPPKVQRVIEARLAQLSPVARELAAVAATIGREFDLNVLTQAYGVGEDTLVRALDELWQRHIVREQDTDTYDFTHDRIREVAYAGLSAARRRLLHRRVAQALEATYAFDLDSVAGQVAAHYERAGQTERAIPHYQRAAKAAQRVYANEEAVAYFQRALKLVAVLQRQQSEQEAWRERAAGLQEGLGDVLHWIGQYDDAIAAYQQALDTVPQQDRIWQSRLHRKRGIIERLQHRFQEGEAAFDLAESVLSEETDQAAQEWWWEWVQIQLERMELLYFARELTRLDLLVERVRADVEQWAAPGQRVNFLGRLFALYTERERIVVSDEAHSYLEAAFAASQELDDLGQTTYIEFGLGYSHLWRGELEQAEQHLRHALELAQQSGNAAYQMLCLTYLTSVGRMKTQVKPTREYARQSLTVAQQVGSPDYMGMAEANLAWIAWREGDLTEAQTRARAALDHWRKPQRRYPFQWAALWPLIGLALARDDLRTAIEHGRALLDPLQQRLPETFEGLLAQAVQAWDSGQAALARARLEQAMDPAREMGYL
jgi:tetratricopeptide (TPR) repeat protein